MLRLINELLLLNQRISFCMYLYVMLPNAKQSITENAERACAFVVPTLKRMLFFVCFFLFNSHGNTCCCDPF